MGDEAAETIRILREVGGFTEERINVISQLLLNRLSDDLILTIILSKEDDIASIFMRVLGATQNSVIVGFVARYLADACQVVPTLAKAVANFPGSADTFYGLSRVHALQPRTSNPTLFLFALSLRYADRPDPATVEKCVTAFVNVFSQTELHVRDVEFPMHALSAFVRRREYRPLLFRANIPAQVVRVLAEACAEVSAGVVQLTYETLRVIWTMTFDYSCVVAMVNAKLLPTVHRVLQRSTKEKCLRVALTILRNLCALQRRYFNAKGGNEELDRDIFSLGAVSSRGPTFSSDLSGIGVHKTLSQLARRKFGDEDIPTLIDELTEFLDSSMEASSSFSEYRGEILSGVLEWTPVHTSAKFWKENAQKFDENGYEVLRCLSNIIHNVKNELTLAVACHDVGELVRHHPSGRMLLDLPATEGLKERLLTLMSHTNTEISKNALLAVQKIMVQRWEYIK